MNDENMNKIEGEPMLEYHPFPPFTPHNAKVLFMGTFPPQPKRWAMEFYYPNRTNDFWKIMGYLFYGNPNALYNPSNKQFDLPAITSLLNEKGIALSDTGAEVRRLKNNASDKFLEIVKPVDLKALLDKMPNLRAIATTGEKAGDTLAMLTSTERPPIGSDPVDWNGIQLWRMPSTSRAYPLPMEQKAKAYARLFEAAGIKSL